MRAVLVAGMGPLTLQDSPSKRTYPHGSHVPTADSCTAAKLKRRVQCIIAWHSTPKRL